MGRRESQLGMNIGVYEKLFKGYDDGGQESPQRGKKGMNRSANMKE